MQPIRWVNLTLRHSNRGERPANVVKRVLDTIGLCTPEYTQLLQTGRFLPAGRTLKTATPGKGVFPNCTVIPPDESLVKECMRHTIGVGVNLDDSADPIGFMHKIGTIPAADATGRKPGIMIAIDWKHEQIKNVCGAKLAVDATSPLFNMNISLLVHEHEWDSFVRSSVFSIATKCAHACGDPGILIIRQGETGRATSPCGELFLDPFEVCNLGNLNLGAYLVKQNRLVSLSLERLYEDAIKALLFLDRVRQHLIYPIDVMRRVSESNARLGLGVMGFADVVSAFGQEYGSSGSQELARAIAQTLQKAATEYKNGSHRKVLSLAPTGGTSLILGASFSIEPHFRDAHKTTPQQHIVMQSIWQKHIDNGVSKTVNLPNEASVEDVATIYQDAFKLGCKGITVYRDDCRQYQPIKIQ